MHHRISHELFRLFANALCALQQHGNTRRIHIGASVVLSRLMDKEPEDREERQNHTDDRDHIQDHQQTGRGAGNEANQQGKGNEGHAHKLKDVEIR